MALAALVLLAVGTPDARASMAKACGKVGRPASDFGAFEIRATHTSCKRARRIARAMLKTVKSPFGYRCRGVWHGGPSQPLPYADWKCTKRRARVTWEGQPKPRRAGAQRSGASLRAAPIERKLWPRALASPTAPSEGL